jgi:SAM-dependent methyltransferase
LASANLLAYTQKPGVDYHYGGHVKFTGERWVFEQAHDHPTQREHVARYEFASKYVANRRVLDLACGTGYGSKLLCDGGAAEVVGGDISVAAVTFAHREHTYSGARYLALNAQALPFRDRSFDVVVSFETIEHLPDFRAYLSEVHRVLNDDGVFIVSTPDKYCYRLFNLGESNPYHVHEFAKEEFVGEISSRFSGVRVYGQCPIDTQEWQNHEKPPVRFKLIKRLLPANVKDRIKQLLGIRPRVLEIFKNLDRNVAVASPQVDYVFYICVAHKSNQDDPT